MKPVDYALLAKRSYADAPTVGRADSASRLHVYGDIHVFRGSDDISSWRADLDVSTVDVWGIGKVHAGFYSALTAILPACLALPRPKAIAGHSLGAALAILYAAVLAQLGDVVPVYAFEPPRLAADDGLQTLLRNRQVPWYACRNGWDVVTQIPPKMSIPGDLTCIGKAVVPFANVIDHDIDRVIRALESE